MKGFWLHERFMDVFIEVLRVQYRDAKRIRLRVRWWNRGASGNPFPIRMNDPITIQTKDLKHWRQCTSEGK